MANNKNISFGPFALPNAATNILTPPAASGGVNIANSAQYALVKWMDIVNKTGGAITVTFYLGGTGGSAAGTEVIGVALSIPANQTYRWNGPLRIDSGQFLTGLASANTSIVLSGELEMGVSG